MGEWKKVENDVYCAVANSEVRDKGEIRYKRKPEVKVA